jgi:hypothetical protein
MPVAVVRAVVVLRVSSARGVLVFHVAYGRILDIRCQDLPGFVS